MSSKNMRYVQVDIEVHDHPKIHRLARMLGRRTYEVWPRVARVWMWALKYYETGNVTDLTADIDELARLWEFSRDDAAEFLDGMFTVRLLDRRARNQVFIHDWDNATGGYVLRLERQRQRTQRCRDKKPTPIDGAPPANRKRVADPSVKIDPRSNETATRPEIAQRVECTPDSPAPADALPSRHGHAQAKQSQEETNQAKRTQDQGAREPVDEPVWMRTPGQSDRPPVLVFINTYNHYFGHITPPPKNRPTPESENYRHIAEAWRAHPDMAWWCRYFERAAASPFLTGQEKNWRADFYWLIEPYNVERVLAGVYDRHIGAPDVSEFILAHLPDIVRWLHAGFQASAVEMERAAPAEILAALREMAANGDLRRLTQANQSDAPHLLPGMVRKAWDAVCERVENEHLLAGAECSSSAEGAAS